MSLFDELAADLEESGPGFFEAENEVNKTEDADDGDMDIDFDEAEDDDSVFNVAKLNKTQHFVNVMEGIKKYENQNDIKIGVADSDPQYKLIVDANNLAMEVDNEIVIIHKYCKDKYKKRFPELEDLVVFPMSYIRIIKEIQNNLDDIQKYNDALSEVISGSEVMVVTMAASSTRGKPLTDDELKLVMEACQLAEELVESKMTILTYVESKMEVIAPNISAIIGASIAARILGTAGGLKSLVRMPACNILVLGSHKKTLSGFSSANIENHTGFIYHSDLVLQNLPVDLRRKGARLVANKITLAARIDSALTRHDSSRGEAFREEILKKFDKWQEPPPVKQLKALPAPKEVARKKRGGRRYRNMKERLGMTEMHKQANRMTFGEIEQDAYQDDIGFSVGQLGKKGSGRIRQAQVDGKTKVRISKSMQQKLNKANNRVPGGMSTISSRYGGKSTVRNGGKSTIRDAKSGMASTVAFTPLKGIEIVTPDASQVKAMEDGTTTYFSKNSSFVGLMK